MGSWVCDDETTRTEMTISGSIFVACIPGSGDGKPVDWSWKRYWSNATGEAFPLRCQMKFCGNYSEFGAHVRARDYNKTMILPLCWECYEDNQYDDNDNTTGWVPTKRTATLAELEWPALDECVSLFPADRVKHVTGSSQFRRREGWRGFWQRKTGEPFPTTCRMHQCGNEAVLGAHVYIEEYGLTEYIIPCCQPCNQDQELHQTWSYVKRDTKVVRASPQ